MPAEHPIYSKHASVFLESGDDRHAALDRAIDASGFLENVEQVFAASGKSRDGFLIALKPNIMTASKREDPSPVYTDPTLVERVFERLRERGFSDFAVVESHNVYDYSYQNRSVSNVAAMAGYKAEGYRIADLSE